MHAHAYIGMYTCIYIDTHTYMLLECMPMRTLVCIHVCSALLCRCICTDICMYICAALMCIHKLYIHTYFCTHIYAFAKIHTYIHAQEFY